MSAGRIARVAATVLAVFLAAVSLRTLHAESAYESGLDVAVDPRRSPALDLPGRLDAYEEAMRRDPGEGLYALRAGQIRLLRAAKAAGGVDRVELETARERLRTAARLRPLDARPRAQLARAAQIADDPIEAVAFADAATTLGPRAPGPAWTAVDVGLWAWRAHGDVSALRAALRGGAILSRIGESRPTTPFARAFQRADAGLAQDLVEAVRGDASLAAFAVEATKDVRPDVARLLETESAPTDSPR